MRSDRSRLAHIKIMVAAAKGRGVTLSADDVFDLSMDDAIATAAANGLDETDWPDHDKVSGHPDWANISLRRKNRNGKNFCV